MTPSCIVDQLLQWCSKHDVHIDDRLEIRWNENTGVAVFSREAIPPRKSVAQINKASVLSTRNCSLSKEITPAFAGPEALYHLTLALYSEILLGSKSKWFGYLQSLPNKVVDLPLFWSSYFSQEGVEDKSLALKWSEGTEISRYHGKRINAITDYYNQIAQPLLEYHFGRDTKPPAYTIEEFYRAYSLVSSRSFLVDAFHGLAMVPIADTFNHSHEHHVHIETDFSVCPECGSLSKCTHDEEDRPQSQTAGPTNPRLSDVDSDPYYEMVSDGPIASDIEIFNTYGENLSNAQLLGRYGFIIEDNDNDLLTWEFEAVFDCVYPDTEGSDGHRIAIMTRLHNLWTSALQESIRNNSLPELSASELVVVDHSSEGSGLFLNGDGRISSSLWILLSVFSFVGTLPDEEPARLAGVMKALQSLLNYQLLIEAGHQPPGDELVPSFIFDRLVRLVICVCEIRKSKLLRKGRDDGLTDPGDLNAFLDELSPTMHRTRYVLLVAIGEYSLLDSCESAWSDFLGLDPQPESPL